MKNIEKLIANSQDIGKRLDFFLSSNLPKISRNKIKRLIINGFVNKKNTKITDPDHTVSINEIYTIIFPDPGPAIPQPQKMNLEVFFEDKDLIVINKPAGLVVHPAPGNNNFTLVNALIAHCEGTLSGVGGIKRPGIVHRLDKDTSGLIVAAKNDFSHVKLSYQFSQKLIQRIYFGIVWGYPTKNSGKIEGNIGRDPKNRKKMALVAPNKGKAALTKYEVSKNYGTLASELFFTLLSGRTHQIRVHSSSEGHSLVGDKTYGGPGKTNREIFQKIIYNNIINRQALHAQTLGFIHPVTGKKLKFESNLPNDINNLRKFFSKNQ